MEYTTRSTAETTRGASSTRWVRSPRETLGAQGVSGGCPAARCCALLLLLLLLHLVTAVSFCAVVFTTSATKKKQSVSHVCFFFRGGGESQVVPREKKKKKKRRCLSSSAKKGLRPSRKTNPYFFGAVSIGNSYVFFARLNPEVATKKTANFFFSYFQQPIGSW